MQIVVVNGGGLQVRPVGPRSLCEFASAKVRMFWEVCNSFPVRREGFPVGREVWCQSVKVSSVKVLFAVRVFGSLYINKNILFIYSGMISQFSLLCLTLDTLTL